MSEVAKLHQLMAKEIAGRLTHWHLLDLGLIYKQGFMRVAKVRPRGKTGELIDWGVLNFVPDSGVGPILTPTKLFLRVYTEARARARKTKSEKGAA